MMMKVQDDGAADDEDKEVRIGQYNKAANVNQGHRIFITASQDGPEGRMLCKTNRTLMMMRYEPFLSL
jgi:hypothetical protein